MFQFASLKELEKEHLVTFHSAVVKLQFQLLNAREDWDRFSSAETQEDFNAALLAVLQTPERAVRVGDLVLYPDLKQWKLPGIAFRKHRVEHSCSGDAIHVTIRLLSREDMKGDQIRFDAQRASFKARRKPEASRAPRAPSGIQRKAGARPLEELKAELRQQQASKQTPVKTVSKASHGKKGRNTASHDDDDDEEEEEEEEGPRRNQERRGQADKADKDDGQTSKAQPTTKRSKVLIDLSDDEMEPLQADNNDKNDNNDKAKRTSSRKTRSTKTTKTTKTVSSSKPTVSPPAASSRRTRSAQSDNHSAPEEAIEPSLRTSRRSRSAAAGAPQKRKPSHRATASDPSGKDSHLDALVAEARVTRKSSRRQV